MPWKEVTPMEQKILFIADYLRSGKSFMELCRSYGISRKIGYKWVRRYHEGGMDALHEHSRKPHLSPQSTPFSICKEIIALRTKRRIQPGPKKIQALLCAQHPEWTVPSKTTIYNILRREGLVEKRKLRRRVTAEPRPFGPVHEPNDLWSADFKGQFLTGDGSWCYPLTIMDHESRYLLDCRALPGTAMQAVQKTFERIFREYGLPRRIRTDNGIPFASNSVRGISHLSRWWIRLGIVPERIEKGKPQQNGNHERMHRTLKDAALRPPARTSSRQQEVFDEVRREYNDERPHEALGQKTPASRYRPSPRRMPDQLPDLEYPGHYRLATVSSHGVMYCFGRYIYVGHVLTGERLGLEEVRDGIWNAYFGPLVLGYVDLTEQKKNRFGYERLKV
jgi:putative transposase